MCTAETWLCARKSVKARVSHSALSKCIFIAFFLLVGELTKKISTTQDDTTRDEMRITLCILQGTCLLFLFKS